MIRWAIFQNRARVEDLVNKNHLPYSGVDVIATFRANLIDQQMHFDVLSLKQNTNLSNYIHFIIRYDCIIFHILSIMHSKIS